MDDQIKKDVKRLADRGQQWLARSLLKWKYKQEGKPLPDEVDLEQRSRQVAEEAKAVLKKRGKTVLEEFKEMLKPRK
ncbi:MAG: hypothetical protein JRH08_04720 [Deltaproteobacteria bacterium]|nr:hypothetical protein [Deltaproteobacteria bacterium]MBW1929583.1 hypothetical protein [Deltaproteobacteria bacterium]MBW2025094.1 hypothetical protein [Deltaproteobacteria bacterium]MBW2125004.1 hypothetical protein [Deltaproteobacteria bacterium]RLB21467.1 MAG: hypothetical protein DRG76_08925 [Deltaproteobacteria bacterium]